MTTRLSHILAVAKDVKTRVERVQTNAYHNAQRVGAEGPLAGISRTYRPKDDEGDRLPPETKIVQTLVENELDVVAEAQIELLDIMLTQEIGDTKAKANIVVDGNVLLADVPATFLLFLEKNLVKLHTEIAKLPVLDPSERWHWDGNAGAYATEPTESARTKKVMRNHVLAEATDKHQAQVQPYNEDVVVGYWTGIRFSGMMPGDRKAALLRRVEKLQQAVKVAREDANSTVVEHHKAGEALFNYLLSR